MALIASLVLFVIFSVNVGLGSMTGSPFLSDVQEMLVLLASSICFVIAIIKREADAKARSK